jgi:hypothetical protein
VGLKPETGNKILNFPGIVATNDGGRKWYRRADLSIKTQQRREISQHTIYVSNKQKANIYKLSAESSELGKGGGTRTTSGRALEVEVGI